MKYIWFFLFSHIVKMKDNAVVIEYIKLPCQRGSINVEFVLIFPSANPLCTCHKEVRNQICYGEDFVRDKGGHT